MTASIAAQHYEMQEPVQYDVLEANGIQCQDYEVPHKTKKDTYSHLQHK